jgi:ATPase subunit of ABC transporter with duplicated ATPase domains
MGTVQVSAQSRVALVGRNGAGKSTLLKVLCGQLSGEPSTSTRSEEGCGEVWREHGHRVALVAQHHIEALQDSAHLSAVDYLLSRVRGAEGTLCC